jgi:hypothetical protein
MIVAGVLASLPLAASCVPTHRAAAPAPSTSMPSMAGIGPEVRQDVMRLRDATARFHDLDTAVTAGYARDVEQCIAHPPHGAMGFHHVNRGHVDARIEVERPEILTYERQSDGRHALTGAEYIIPYRLWPADSTPPTAFGQNLRHADDLRIWYLHVWVWRENPAGLFADWNPAVRCPEG